MQPYFFPYLGYFAIMHYVDKWIVFDEAQYIYHGWINRNRILNYNKDWQYVTAPIQKHSRDIKIKDVVLANHIQWRDKLLAQLQQYRKRAPYFSSVIEVVREAVNVQEESLSALNTHVLRAICGYLGISVTIEVFSKRNWDIGEVQEADEWALRISESLGAKQYVNPPNGKMFFDEAKWSKSEIELRFLKIRELEYSQKNAAFIPNLSVIDVMMFLEPAHIREAMERYDFI